MLPQLDRFLLVRCFNPAYLMLVFLSCASFFACSDADETKVETPSDVISSDGLLTQAVLDAVELGSDSSEDAVVTPEFAAPPFVAPDNDLRLSLAFGELFAPLGISTAG